MPKQNSFPSKAMNCSLKLFVFGVCVFLTSMNLLKDMGSVYQILTWSISLGADESSCGASMKKSPNMIHPYFGFA